MTTPYWIMGVLSSQVGTVWGQAAPMLQRALDAADPLTTTDRLRRNIESRDMQLWLVMRLDREEPTPVAAAVTEVLNFDLGSVLTVVALAGDGMVEWLDLFEETMTNFAKEHGCRALHLHGRKGWVKVLAKYGWAEQTVNMVKEIAL